MKYSDKQKAKWLAEQEKKFGGKGQPSMNDGSSLNGDERGAFSKPRATDPDLAHRRPRKIYVSEP